MADLNGLAVGLTVKAEEDIYADPEATLLRAKADTTIMFRINTATKLKKLKRAYCVKLGVAPEAMVFTFGGVAVGDAHSASDLFMLDQDVIVAKHAKAFLHSANALPSTRVRDFGRLLESGDFADVRLVAGAGPEQTYIPTCKAILSARSAKFRGLFSGSFADSAQPEVPLPSCRPHLLRPLLHYLYTDEVEMPAEADDVAGLLVLADEYLQPALKRACEVALLPQVNKDNACTLLHTADVYEIPMLKEVCMQFVLSHFEEFPELGEELLEKFPQLLLEVTRTAVGNNKRRRLW